jgi:organic radical activating enzyme
VKFGTMSIVVGGPACNASCPFCVSKQTGMNGLDKEGNLSRLGNAAMLARQGGVSTVLLTGKGEPTLYPDEITRILSHNLNHRFDVPFTLLRDTFPLIELQTNGLNMLEPETQTRVAIWKQLGLTTICLSVVHWESEMNQKIYTPNKEYPELSKTINSLHELGFSVRLSCIGLDGYIDTPSRFLSFVHAAKHWGVEQFTWRPVYGSNPNYYMPKEGVEKIKAYCDEMGTLLLEMGHGALVYDLHGQNVCLTNCLTETTNTEEIRQLIYFPDGHLRYSWQYEGAIIL